MKYITFLVHVNEDGKFKRTFPNWRKDYFYRDNIHGRLFDRLVFKLEDAPTDVGNFTIAGVFESDIYGYRVEPTCELNIKFSTPTLPDPKPREAMSTIGKIFRALCGIK